jgi:bisphosphoglycerate-dependent phosphoglycerate mutase
MGFGVPHSYFFLYTQHTNNMMDERESDNLTERHYNFLDGLRESGITNMWGASPFLEDEFPELNKQEAKAVLLAWMDQCAK